MTWAVFHQVFLACRRAKGVPAAPCSLILPTNNRASTGDSETKSLKSYKQSNFALCVFSAHGSWNTVAEGCSFSPWDSGLKLFPSISHILLSLKIRHIAREKFGSKTNDRTGTRSLQATLVVQPKCIQTKGNRFSTLLVGYNYLGENLKIGRDFRNHLVQLLYQGKNPF